MPTVACMTRSICSSRLAHWRVIAFFSRSNSYFIDEKSIDDRPQVGDGSDCLRRFFSLMLLDVVQQLVDGQMREIVLSPALIVEWFTGHVCEEA